MDVWTETTTVRAFETDVHRRWKPACFFQNMQQAATHHAAHLGFDFDSMLAAGRIWILSRVKFIFTDFPLLGETVTIRTWPKGIGQKIFFLRDFEFSGQDERPLAVATTAWILLDPAARRMLLPQTFTGHLPDNRGRFALDEPLEKLAISDDLVERFTVQAGYSAVDVMGHVNNARYVEWACDSLPYGAFSNGPMRWLQINYLNEVRPGERVSLRAGGNGAEWRVCGQNLDSGQRAYEAVVAF